jgi:hypothetical protein
LACWGRNQLLDKMLLQLNLHKLEEEGEQETKVTPY